MPIEELKQALKRTCQELYSVEVAPEISRPEERFGDYATNVALHVANKLGKNPREIAEQLAANLKGDYQASIAGPGFINFKLSDDDLAKAAAQATDLPKSLNGQTIVAEYSDPNPFKVLHAGHLYTSVVGDVIANLLENAGAVVHRVNFGGDVGLHVAKTMWSIKQELGGWHFKKLENIVESGDLDLQAGWLSDRYIEGNNIYDVSDAAKKEIIELNKEIYRVQDLGDHNSELAKIYWETRKWSYDYFKYFYNTIGITPFEEFIPESETAPIGLKVVREQLAQGVYEESQGAVIFDGEKLGLHTRVFINSEGLPTYETKDVGLLLWKWNKYNFDKSLVITGNDIVEYMKVVLKSVEQFLPEPADRTQHITHGQVKLAGGVKMSSRKGNILRALDIISTTGQAARQLYPDSGFKGEAFERVKFVTYGAVKYAFLKNRIGGDVIYDPAESVTLEGNSGPYLQYAHARAASILAKTNLQGPSLQGVELDESERSLARKISEYPEVVQKATEELLPHYICTYLYELAQNFNRFYEQSRVIGDPRQNIRLQLLKNYQQVLKSGLRLLNITAPEKI